MDGQIEAKYSTAMTALNDACAFIESGGVCSDLRSVQISVLFCTREAWVNCSSMARSWRSRSARSEVLSFGSFSEHGEDADRNMQQFGKRCKLRAIDLIVTNKMSGREWLVCTARGIEVRYLVRVRGHAMCERCYFQYSTNTYP